MSDPPAAIDYVARWRGIVAARREQHDAVCAAQGRTTDDYWARRAQSYQKFVRESAGGSDPFVALVRRHIEAEDVLLDVGAGTGRHSIPLAAHCKRVIALDPSQAMLGFLRQQVADQEIGNIEMVEGGWPDAAAEAPAADVVFSAHVLYPIEDVEGFLRAMDAHAARLCLLHLMARQPWFDQIGLWEAVHGSERMPQPTHIDVVNVLQQLGCHANVEVAHSDVPRRFDSLDDAVERFAESIAVGDDGERRQRLRAALAERLELSEGGVLTLPLPRYPLATVWWEAGALTA